MKTATRPDHFQISIMADALEYHFGPEGDCSATAPCEIAAAYLPHVSKGEVAAISHDEVEPTTARKTAGAPTSNQYGTFTVHAATPAQIRFACRLVGERDIPNDAGLMTASLDQLAKGNISKKSISDLIDWLQRRPAMPGTVVDGPSEKQLALLDRLLGEKVHPFKDVLVNEIRTHKKATSKMIDELFKMPRKQQVEVEIEVGMYRTADGTMYRAYFNQPKTRVLAKKLVPADGGWEFEYAGIASRFVTQADRMTLDEAKAWGAQYGTCCLCSKLLTDPESVAAGIGPICKDKV